MSAVCSECGGSLADKKPGSKTCGSACRSKRSRRLARQQRAKGHARAYPEHAAEAALHANPGAVKDVAHDLLEQELRPVVREAITEDALKAIRSMVGLTPRVVELLGQDMESDDAVIRQRAYTLIAKYTLGHQAIVTPADAGSGQQLVVNFGLPRPGQAPSETQQLEPAVDSTAEETQPCDTCNEDKPLSDFVAGSTRCTECFGRLQREVAERFGGDVE